MNKAVTPNDNDELPVSALDAAAAVVAHVEQDETATAVARVARRFTALIRAAGIGSTAPEGRDPVADLTTWITEAKTCGAPAIATFAAGLEGDEAAVKGCAHGAAARSRGKSTASS